jgi:GT2 family glycosyltransferase
LNQELDTREFRKGTIRLSVVSHGQDDLVEQLLDSLAKYCQGEHLYITLIRNTQSPNNLFFKQYPFPVTILQNIEPKGFGANHNLVFTNCQEEYFCVLNPDILLCSNLFQELISCFADKSIGVVAPALVDSDGRPQDSARRYPSPGRILRRVVRRKTKGDNQFVEPRPEHPYWIAGMFMLFPAQIYQKVGGFDERFFMYCEDADICMRLDKSGYTTQLNSQVRAVHNARRASHQTLRHLRWHVASLLRFFFRYPFYTL